MPAQSQANRNRPLNYAVVGLGYIAQIAILPAFRRARRNSRLTALVSDDPVKLNELSDKYGVQQRYSYDRYSECLGSGQVDAVYIALPNHLHHEYAVRAANAGVHVLCEKPMAMSVDECRAMIDVARAKRVKLMIAYRLHFEPANLRAIEISQSGRLGDLRIFSSTFTMQVKPDNVRLSGERGGGTLYDIGIYCINAARYLFRSEPHDVFACSVRGRDPRFSEVDEMTTAVMRFPGDRLAQFTCSFGAADTSTYTLIGTKGALRAEPAYEHAAGLQLHVTVDGKTTHKRLPQVDQFAAELLHFSDCVQTGRDPTPSGKEGLADIQIIEALIRSVQSGAPVQVAAARPAVRPKPEDEIRRRPTRKPQLVHAASPTKE
jgi:predicted dehydrogenase